MNIGKIYEIKRLFWYLYPSKEFAFMGARGPLRGTPSWRALLEADFISERLNCNVSCISPNSTFVLLEQDGEYCKILTDNGAIGWIFYVDWCKEHIRETKS
jgi:hypothetical protein